jgi:hypothetical protein
MLSIFRLLADRVKALFLTDAALDLEAQLLTRDAERQAELLRQAQRYEEEGLTGIAQHLRQRAEATGLERPLASIVPALANMEEALPGSGDTTLLSAHGRDGSPAAEPRQRLPHQPGPKKKGR